MIIAHFQNGREIMFTRAIFALLKTDPEINFIFDAETGEIIFERH